VNKTIQKEKHAIYVLRGGDACRKHIVC